MGKQLEITHISDNGLLSELITTELCFRIEGEIWIRPCSRNLASHA